MSNLLLKELATFAEVGDLEALEKFLIRSGASVLAEELGEIVSGGLIDFEGDV
jgi:hypothetical protein